MWQERQNRMKCARHETTNRRGQDYFTADPQSIETSRHMKMGSEHTNGPKIWSGTPEGQFQFKAEIPSQWSQQPVIRVRSEPVESHPYNHKLHLLQPFYYPFPSTPRCHKRYFSSIFSLYRFINLPPPQLRAVFRLCHHTLFCHSDNIF
jgi:hypothetical protein